MHIPTYMQRRSGIEMCKVRYDVIRGLCRIFGRLMIVAEGSAGPQYSTTDPDLALLALIKTCDAPGVTSTNAALAHHALAWYRRRIGHLDFQASSSENVKALQAEANTYYEMLLGRQIQVRKAQNGSGLFLGRMSCNEFHQQFQQVKTGLIVKAMVERLGLRRDGSYRARHFKMFSFPGHAQLCSDHAILLPQQPAFYSENSRWWSAKAPSGHLTEPIWDVPLTSYLQRPL